MSVTDSVDLYFPIFYSVILQLIVWVVGFQEKYINCRCWHRFLLIGTITKNV